MSKPVVFLTHNDFPEIVVQLLKEHFTVKCWQSEISIPRKSLLENVKGTFGILCRKNVKIDGELVDAAGPSFKVASTFSAGYDHFNVDELRERGIRMGYTAGKLAEATAELAVTLLLSTSRRFIECCKIVRDNRWPRDARNLYFLCGRGLDGATVGIVGCGRIGLSVAKKLKPFNIDRLLYCSRSEKPEAIALGGQRKSIDDVMKESDFIVVTLALNDETYRIVNKERINSMKPNAIIVNVSRGGLIDQAALTEALVNKKIGGAGLDVTDPEPISEDDPLLSMDNVVITPHIGAITYRSLHAASELAARNIIAVFEGKEMPAELK